VAREFEEHIFQRRTAHLHVEQFSARFVRSPHQVHEEKVGGAGLQNPAAVAVNSPE